MHKFIGISLILSGLFAAIVCEAKGKKPQVCIAFKEDTLVVDGTSQKVAICQDGKKPTILTEYTIQTIKDENGASVKAAIGYR